MGNCCRPGKSSMVWAGDDSDSLLISEEPKKSHQNIIGAAAAASSTCSSSNSYSGGVREVKIRITKKELQELVESANNAQGIPVEEVLARLISNKIGNSHHHHHQHPWKPTLNSIPE